MKESKVTEKLDALYDKAQAELVAIQAKCSEMGVDRALCTSALFDLVVGQDILCWLDGWGGSPDACPLTEAQLDILLAMDNMVSRCVGWWSDKAAYMEELANSIVEFAEAEEEVSSNG